MNPFDHLGIPRGSSSDVIRSAYRRLAKSVHPDHNPGDDAAASRFAMLQETYQAALRAAAIPPEPESPQGSPKRPVRHRTVYKDVVIDVSQAISGTMVRMEGASGLCQHCTGTGRLASTHPVGCATCDGSGVISVQSKGYVSVRLECHECQGTGTTTTVPCHHCGGFGVSSTEPCDVAIPANVRDGDVFRVNGVASIPSEGVKGDIEFVVRISDRRFRVVEDDVEAPIWMDVWQAARGGSFPARLPDGTTARLTIPAGTIHGRRFTMKGRGMPATEEADAGDFIAIASIRPVTATTPEIEAALAALEKAVLSSRQ
ncbi:J domain-containing protein [Agrobacterium rubi]|nr:J domain-containing protein [Agrobacterium rubi]NTF24379.1 J domain-containing protein [Agrobacterium rubi]